MSFTCNFENSNILKLVFNFDKFFILFDIIVNFVMFFKTKFLVIFTERTFQVEIENGYSLEHHKMNVGPREEKRTNVLGQVHSDV